MTNPYEPEVGQMAFGQPSQRLECPEPEETALKCLANAWEALTSDDSPFSNTGARYDGTAFSAHAYSWDDSAEQEFNFKWRDFRASWYKYLGRGMSVNRELSRAETAEMLSECVSELCKRVAALG